MRRKTAPPILKQAADITRADPAAPCHPLDVQLWIAQAAGDLGLDRLEPRRLHAGLLGQRRTVDVRRGDGGDQVADMPGGERPRRARDRFGAQAQHVDIGVEQAQKRSEEHTSELQSLMRISYAVFCLKNNKTRTTAA